MNAFTVTQRLLSIGPSYRVKTNSSDDILMSVLGRTFSVKNQVEIKEGMNGNTIAKMKANKFKTRYVIEDRNGKNIGYICFPIIPFLKKITLKINGLSFKSKSGFLSNKFVCEDKNHNCVLTIAKDVVFKDKFTVLMDNFINKAVGILAAVALDQKYYETDEYV